MAVLTIEERAYSPECYLAGCNAAWVGETIDDCPYIPGWERDEWRAGFDEAIHGMPWKQTGRRRASCSDDGCDDDGSA